MTGIRNIVVLTGAGISAESGLATFRAQDGLWCDHRVEDVATPQAFARNPSLVQQFYNMRRAQLQSAEPNEAHLALAELASRWTGNLLLVTQNVDDLHQRALASVTQQPGFSFLPMHGELKKIRCLRTGKVSAWEKDLTPSDRCACCGVEENLRPHIVWFGEMPLGMDMIDRALRDCDLFISIGTSGNVYPAAGFVQLVRAHTRGHTVELNLEPSLGHSSFHERIYGPATQTVPEYIKGLLSLT